MDDQHLSRAARRLRDLVEPLAASVYFAPECHENFHQLGFDPSTRLFGGVAAPDGPAYFTSRGACLGKVPGEVVVAAFGVFNPAVVVPSVTLGWERTDPRTILRARMDGQRAQLHRLLGSEPKGAGRATELFMRAADALPMAGRHLFSGLRADGFPGDVVGDLWRASDLVREGRGDSHIAAWVSAGLGPTDISILTELWWGLPHKSYSLSRGWSVDELDAAGERMRSRGYLNGDELTDAGRQLRRDIEAATDRQDLPMVAAIGDDLGELFDILEPWAKAIIAGKGYPDQAFQTTSDLDA